MARIVLDSGASAVTPGSPYGDTVGASLRDLQLAVDSALSSINSMTAELMSTTTTTWGTAAPTTGAHTIGDKHMHTAPANGGFIGWVCTSTGTPGTWKRFGIIEA